MGNESLFWDKMAKKYAAKPVPSQEIYDKKLKLTRNLLKPDMKVLEIGCGTGTTSLIHAPYVKQILSTDFSSEMIQIATNKSISQGVSNITFKQESVQDMDYPENEFDIIMAHSILHLIENKKEVLTKVFKSLKPGGYFVTTTGCIGGFYKIFKPIWFIGFHVGQLPYLGFFTKKNFINQVEETGFDITTQWDPTKIDLFLIATKN